MAKEDFKFYKLSDVDADLVIPQIDCDPYMGYEEPCDGMFVTRIIEDLTISGLQPACQPVITSGELEKNWCYMKKLRESAVPLHLEHASVIIEPQDKDKFGFVPEVSKTVGRLHRLNADRIKRTGARLMAFGFRNTEEFPFTSNDRGETTIPTIRVVDGLQLRAYHWRQGDERVSANGDKLVGSFNASRYPVNVLASVTIQFA